jgi:LmbE family N-acetylglucosaminyl deacetylase
MITRRQQQTEEFVRILGVLEPVEFLGVAKLLGVEIFTYTAAGDETSEAAQNGETKQKAIATPREANEILNEIIAHFMVLSKQKQREMLKAFRPLLKKKEKRNGTTT